MLVKYAYRLFLLSGLVLLCNNCVEEFEFGTQNFENILVVESTLTDELVMQEVLISRTFRLENEGPASESNATVRVIDDQQVEYLFSESESGQYISNIAFAAEPGRSYQLQITTQDGVSYASRSSRLPQDTQIDNMYAERVINDDGVEGIGIFIDSFDPTGNANFYRYEFDETYQIIPPFWSNLDLEIISDDPPEVSIVQRVREERVCYKTEKSNKIILTTTNDLSENRINRFMVHFLTPDDVALRNRYSILIRQFVQSVEAQNFYETLRNFSDSESLFSQVQPGFIEGNIFPVDNQDKNVLGFFGIASMSSDRIFIDLKDFFPDVFRPRFDANCTLFESQNVSDIIEIVRRRDLKLVAFDGNSGVYVFTIAICSDCNVLGSNIRPDFWED